MHSLYSLFLTPHRSPNLVISIESISLHLGSHSSRCHSCPCWSIAALRTVSCQPSRSAHPFPLSSLLSPSVVRCFREKQTNSRTPAASDRQPQATWRASPLGSYSLQTRQMTPLPGELHEEDSKHYLEPHHLKRLSPLTL